jgi:hypothetical protein
MPVLAFAEVNEKSIEAPESKNCMHHLLRSANRKKPTKAVYCGIYPQKYINNNRWRLYT